MLDDGSSRLLMHYWLVNALRRQDCLRDGWVAVWSSAARLAAALIAGTTALVAGIAAGISPVDSSRLRRGHQLLLCRRRWERRH